MPILETRSEVNVSVTQKCMHTLNLGFLPSNNMTYALDTNINKTRSEVKGHSDLTMVHNNLPSQDASTHQIWDSYLKDYRRYALDTKRDEQTV